MSHFPVKACAKCGDRAELDHFPPNKHTPDGHSPWCRECHREAVRDWRRRNGDLENARRRARTAERRAAARRRRQVEEARVEAEQLRQALIERGFYEAAALVEADIEQQQADEEEAGDELDISDLARAEVEA